MLLLYKLSELLPSIFVGPPKVTFGTDAFFFGSSRAHINRSIQTSVSQSQVYGCDTCF